MGHHHRHFLVAHQENLDTVRKLMASGIRLGHLGLHETSIQTNHQLTVMPAASSNSARPLFREQGEGEGGEPGNGEGITSEEPRHSQ